MPKVPQKPLAPPRLNKKGRHPTSDSKITGKHSTQAEARPHIRDRNKPHNKIKPAQPKHRLTDKGKQTMKDRRVPNKVNAAPRAPHSKKNGVTTILNGADRRHFNHYSHYSAGKGGEGRHRVNNHGFTGRGRSEEKYRR